ncbi:MAG: hypothetical protein KC503_40300 [Myxococcales bacterium]|nr:hypothetical protein [Myxococcales bacterium]
MKHTSTMVVAVMGALALAGCPKKSGPGKDRAGQRIRADKGQLVHKLGVAVASGARGPGELFAAGTVKGGVIVALRDNAEPFRLLDDIDVRRRKKAASAGTGTGTGSGTGKGTASGAGTGSGTGSGTGTGTAAKPAKAKGPLPPEHDSTVVALDFSPDGKRLVSVGGHYIVAWDVAGKKMIKQLRGPYGLTAGVFAQGSDAAFFATNRGHVLRWRFDKLEAEGVNGFNCRPTPVPVELRGVPEDKRCRYGRFALVENNKPVCLYPVTQLIRRGKRLVRACREGSVGILDLSTRKVRWSSVAGALGALTFIDDQRLLFARRDGELRTWKLGEGRVGTPLLPGVRAQAAVAGAGIVAVGSRGIVRLWHAGSHEVAGAVKVPGLVVYLGLREKPLRLEVLLDDGRFVVHPLRFETKK